MRMPFIHGLARLLAGLAKTETPLGAWLRGLLARIAKATLRRGARFEPGHRTVTA